MTIRAAHERDGAGMRVFDLSIPGFGQASGGARTRRGNKQGFVEQPSDENAAWQRDAVDRWRR
jgi:hypothetical protein